MTALLTELKVRARLRVNGLRRAGGGQVRLRDCLNEVARHVGFLHWEHARRVLGGEATAGDDMGSFWHAPRTGVLLNQWFAQRDRAMAAHRQQPAAFLLPYRRQFMLVEADFVRELGVDPAAPAWQAVGRDLVSGYGSAAWLALARQRVQAPRASFA
ncbi:MAG TPA: hypothetical protein VFE82_06000 [Ramlibacter sp.]|jgi:hypothetical protein|uniref:hypothetical protein n=1 Tax=Ramlibacter sp. TaxID=1917967 RepID=UPI002D47BB41|nr:hypothetical protein [Ramlibacter sp.]HZY18016.1 hypothetical protein [Ramlibacter sp.]